MSMKWIHQFNQLANLDLMAQLISIIELCRINEWIDEFCRDGNMLVETLIFNSFGKLQPFTVSLHTSAAIVIDIHCSLTSSEVVGYLAGIWDMNSNCITTLLSVATFSQPYYIIILTNIYQSKFWKRALIWTKVIHQH